jgi:hypothetical protein
VAVRGYLDLEALDTRWGNSRGVEGMPGLNGLLAAADKYGSIYLWPSLTAGVC